jgi:MFS family permease
MRKCRRILSSNRPNRRYDSVTNKSAALPVVFGWNVVINLFYIPGTIGGAFLIDYLGPKNTMILGLLLQALFGFIMSGLYTHLANHIGAFAVLYGLFLSFGELGPGNNLGLLAAKTSPTAIRGQFYGVAAAIGKVGAFIGTYTFPQITDSFTARSATLGITGPFWVGSALAVFSAIITFFFIRPLTTDGMAEEDMKVRQVTRKYCSFVADVGTQFREYLSEHGYDISQMGLHDEASSSRVDSIDVPEKKIEA